MGSLLGGGGDGGAKKAARAAQQAAEQASQGIIQGSQTAAGAQTEARDYLMQADALPTGFREAALKDLGSLYGLNYGSNGMVSSGSGSILDRAMASPMYQAAIKNGEDAVLRNASATGGLRSGSASENLARVNQDALISSYQDQIAGLQGLSALPSNANNIAGYTASIGNTLGQGQMNAAQTLAQGRTAAAQSKAQGDQNSANNTNQLIGTGIMAAAMMFSDRRLKKEIKCVGKERGIRKYTWIWNSLAESLGLHGTGSGVMAHEVEDDHPDAVSVKDGYLIVDYSKLGVSYGV